MRTLIHSLFLLVALAITPAPSDDTHGGAYEAHWLTNKALGEYVNLILTRRPLAELPTLSPKKNQSVADCDAVIVTTYARDSIWNVDQKPFKRLTGVETVGTDFIIIKGERFVCTQANLEDVLRLLRNPMGKVLIHRIFPPVSGQEAVVRTLAARLERQLTDRKKAEDQQDGAANRSQPVRSETNQTSSAAGSRR